MRERTNNSQLAACVSNADLQLTSQERMLIKNFRAMEDIAKHTLVDVSEEWAAALPTAPARLALVISGPVDAHQ